MLPELDHHVAIKAAADRGRPDPANVDIRAGAMHAIPAAITPKQVLVNGVELQPGDVAQVIAFDVVFCYVMYVHREESPHRVLHWQLECHRKLLKNRR
jgi:hypothetical protein